MAGDPLKLCPGASAPARTGEPWLVTPVTNNMSLASAGVGMMSADVPASRAKRVSEAKFERVNMVSILG